MKKFKLIDNIQKKFNNDWLKDFFKSDKFIALISLMLSSLLWFIFTGMNSEKFEIVISDIPVTISLSEQAMADELRIFSGQNITARINVTGNKLVVPKISASDIQIVALQAPNITSPGNYTLELTPKKAGIITDYEFTSEVQPRFINVTVDRFRETELPLENQINFIADQGLFVGNTVISPLTVKISGPESEVTKVKKGAVIKNFVTSLNSTQKFNVPVTLYDNFDKVISSDKIVISANEVGVTIPILVQKEIKIVPNFVNVPENIEIENIVKITPELLEIAAPSEIFSKLNEVNLPEIDFSKVSFKNFKFIQPINLPSDCRSLRNIYSADVILNMEKFREKQIWVTNFLFENVPENRTAKVFSGGQNVKIFGLSSKIEHIKASDISLVIDLQNKSEILGNMEVPCKVKIENNRDFWCPEEYLVNISVNDKESEES